MKKIVALFFLFLFSSCEKELDITLPYDEDRLVLLSILSPLEPVRIKIERTYPPTGLINFDTKYLQTVTGEFFENGKEVAKLKQLDGFIFGLSKTIKIIEGNEYYFKIRAQGFKEAISLPSRIPSIPIIKEFTFGEDIISPSNVEIPTKKMSFLIDDIKDTKNYYSVSFLSYFENQIVINNFLLFEANSGVKNKCYFNNGQEFQFDDICFNNQVKRLDFAAELEGFTQTNGVGIKRIQNFKVKIKNVSEAYNQFYTTGVEDLTFLQAFSPIKPRISNIKNGYGLVVGINEVIFEVKI